MANSNTIKQKVLDILFEPEPSDEEDEKSHSLDDVKINRKQSTIKAKDLLYKKEDEKKEHSSTFIDINEITSEQEKIADNKNFVSSPNLSPIFGLVDNKKKNKKSANDSTINYATLNKPNSSYLGIVLSPVYGYDSIKDDKNSKNKNYSKDISDETSDLFATEEFNAIENEDESLNSEGVELIDTINEEEDI